MPGGGPGVIRGRPSNMRTVRTKEDGKKVLWVFREVKVESSKAGKLKDRVGAPK